MAADEGAPDEGRERGMLRHECPSGGAYLERGVIRLSEVAGVWSSTRDEGSGRVVREVVLGRSLASVLERDEGRGGPPHPPAPGSGKVALDEPGIPVKLLSRTHAVIEVWEGARAAGVEEVRGTSSSAGETSRTPRAEFRLKPRSDVNGTYVNGEIVEDKVDGVVLQHGDQVSFGGPPGTVIFGDIEVTNPFVFRFVESEGDVGGGDGGSGGSGDGRAPGDRVPGSPSAKPVGKASGLGGRGSAGEEGIVELGTAGRRRDVIDLEQISSQATSTPGKRPGVVDLTDADEVATRTAEKRARWVPRSPSGSEVEVLTFGSRLGEGGGLSPGPSPSRPGTETETRGTGLRDAVAEEFACAICQEVMVAPQLLQCSHSFCGPCLYNWLERKLECPVCRTNVDTMPYSVRAVDKMIEMALSQGKGKAKGSSAETELLRTFAVRNWERTKVERQANLQNKLQNLQKQSYAKQVLDLAQARLSTASAARGRGRGGSSRGTPRTSRSATRDSGSAAQRSPARTRGGGRGRVSRGRGR